MTPDAWFAASLLAAGWGLLSAHRPSAVGSAHRLVPSFVPKWWKNGAPDRMKLGTRM